MKMDYELRINNDMLEQIDNIDRQCDDILEQVRQEILNPNDALNQLKDFYWRISNE